MFDWLEKHPGKAITALVVFAFAFAIGGNYIKSHFEAAAYRKFCDTPVTTWDAFFLDLRIDECVK